MKYDTHLRRFEYSILGLNTNINDTQRRNNPDNKAHLPSMMVNIDFEKGNLCIEGIGQRIMTAVRKAELTRYTSENDRIKVNATIYQGFIIDLSDFTNNGVIFSVDGTINHNEHINSCSGLIILSLEANKDSPEGKEWHLIVYLFDDRNEQEIRLKLDINSDNALLN